MAEKQPGTLQFVPFNSFLDAGFWHKLSHNKLNVYGLDDSVKSIQASYYNGDPVGMPCRLSLDHTAFDVDGNVPARCFRSSGSLLNTNSLDNFKEIDKKLLLDKAGAELWGLVTSSKAVEDPSLLSRFLLLTFADLKKYHFYYWFAFPCLSPSVDYSHVKEPQRLLDLYSQLQVTIPHTN